jgi:hypothetical protein
VTRRGGGERWRGEGEKGKEKEKEGRKRKGGFYSPPPTVFSIAVPFSPNSLFLFYFSLIFRFFFPFVVDFL